MRAVFRSLFLVALAVAGASSVATASPSPPTVAGSPRRVAVVVGANAAAPGRKPLRFAHNDADRVARIALLTGVAPGDLHVLHDPEPAAVLAELDRVLGALGAEGGDALLLFYYSGHADAQALYPAGKRLELASLRQRLDDPRAQVRIGIIDACRGGGWTGAKGLSPAEPFAVDLPLGLTNAGSVLIASSSGLEDAHESETLTGSFFTHHWIAGLSGAADDDGDGLITLAEAFQYARTFTIRDTARHTRSPQHPSFQVNLRGRRDLPLVRLTAATSPLTVEQVHGPLELVHLDTGVVLLEIPRGRRTVKLAVPPGRYLVRRESESRFSAREIEVVGGKVTTVNEADLVLVGDGRLALKGVGGPRLEDAVTHLRQGELVRVATGSGSVEGYFGGRARDALVLRLTTEERSIPFAQVRGLASGDTAWVPWVAGGAATGAASGFAAILVGEALFPVEPDGPSRAVATGIGSLVGALVGATLAPRFTRWTLEAGADPARAPLFMRPRTSSVTIHGGKSHVFDVGDADNDRLAVDARVLFENVFPYGAAGMSLTYTSIDHATSSSPFSKSEEILVAGPDVRLSTRRALLQAYGALGVKYLWTRRSESSASHQHLLGAQAAIGLRAHLPDTAVFVEFEARYVQSLIELQAERQRRFAGGSAGIGVMW